MTVNIDRRTFVVGGLVALASVIASAHAGHASPSDQDGGSDHGKGKGGSTKDHGGDHSDDHNDDHTHDDGHDSSSDHGGRGKGPKYRGGRNTAQQVKGRPGRSLEDQVLKSPHF